MEGGAGDLQRRAEPGKARASPISRRRDLSLLQLSYLIRLRSFTTDDKKCGRLLPIDGPRRKGFNHLKMKVGRRTSPRRRTSRRLTITAREEDGFRDAPDIDGTTRSGGGMEATLTDARSLGLPRTLSLEFEETD